MDHSTEHLRTYLIELLQQHNVDAATLSREIGRSKDYIRDFIEGRKQSISLASLKAIEKKFVISQAKPLADFYAESEREAVRIQTNLDEADKLGVIGIFPMRQEGRLPGEITIGSIGLEAIARPSFLPAIGAPYGLVVDTESMSPLYDPGDTIFLNPALGMRKHTDVIVLPEDIESKEKSLVWNKALFARLIDFDSQKLYLHIFNPSTDFEVERNEWLSVDRIVARHHRR